MPLLSVRPAHLHQGAPQRAEQQVTGGPRNVGSPSSPQGAPPLGGGRHNQLEPRENWSDTRNGTHEGVGGGESPSPRGEQPEGGREGAAAQAPILALLTGSCVTLGKGLPISEPQFPRLQNGDIPSPYSPGGTAAEHI